MPYEGQPRSADEELDSKAIYELIEITAEEIRGAMANMPDRDAPVVTAEHERMAFDLLAQKEISYDQIIMRSFGTMLLADKNVKTS